MMKEHGESLAWTFMEKQKQSSVKGHKVKNCDIEMEEALQMKSVLLYSYEEYMTGNFKKSPN